MTDAPTAEATEDPAPDRPLGVGDAFPDVTLLDQDGEQWSSADLAADDTLIAFFYPIDSSMGCVTQTCAIRDNWPLLRANGINVVGINSGSKDSHANFRGKYGLPYPLLVDEGRELAQAFGFVHRIPGFSGTPTRVERSTVIVDPGGTIRAVLRKVKPAAHFDMLRVELNLTS